MKSLCFVLLLLIQSTILQSQDFLKSGSLAEIEKTAPYGYSVLFKVLGDLNKDSFADLILVYKKDNEETAIPDDDAPLVRPLLIYIGQKNGAYRLAARNDKVVYCYHCGGVMGDPFSEITIKDGSFTILHYGGSSWRWTRDLTFTYAKKYSAWYLHKEVRESFHSADPDNGTITTKTVKDFGSIRFEAFDIYSTN